MSSEATTELSDLVEEWLRVDRVRANGVLQYYLLMLRCTADMMRTPKPNRRFQIYGQQDILKN
jgi:hypothetical protein